MALAYDASAQGTTGSSSLTFSHTCTGTNLILIVAARFYTSDHITGITYNGVSMTLINKQQDNVGNNCYSYLFYLINPATGTHDVVVSADATPSIQMCAASASYTGAKQTGQPDSNNSQSSTATTMTISTTVVASDCWLVGCTSNFRATAAGSGTTNRQQVAGDPFTLSDSNGTVGTGSQSLQWTQADTTISGQNIASIAPALSGPANVKTVNGLAIASVKTFDGLATGSIKTINGLN